MAIKGLQASADKYGTNGAAAGTYWQQGAKDFQGDPTALAAAQATKAKSNFGAAIDSGRWARRLAQAGKQAWLNGINDPNSVSAFTNAVGGKGKTKWQAAMTNWWPVFQGLSDQISQMPDTTPQDSINRVAAWINGTIAAKQNL